MGAKWTKEQHAKFKATMEARKGAVASPEQSIPLDAIPAREPRGKRAKAGNGVVQLHAEVDKHSGELCLVIGSLRVPLRLR
jgi:hypothetical protein